MVLVASQQGIVGDGQTLNTKAIQDAIDRISSSKMGGVLVFTEGRYLTGMLSLKSNVELRLEKDAVVLGSTNPYDYPRPEVDVKAEMHDNAKFALLCASNADNIAITGEGLINAQGRDLALNIDSLHHTGECIDPLYNYRRLYPNETARPKLFFISHCNNVRIEGITAMNSACWGLSFEQSSNVCLTKVKVRNRAFWNNDGMDFTDCSHVRIIGCDINSGDDALCLKSYDRMGGNEDFVIEDCDLMCSSNAIKLGTASYGYFRNIRIKNIRVKDLYRSAIALECVDGGEISDIVVEDVVASNCRNTFFLRIGQRNCEMAGKLHDVIIRNVKADICLFRPDQMYEQSGPDVSFFHNAFPACIAGLPDHLISNVSIENVEVSYPGRATKGMAYVGLYRVKDIPENPAGYPEHTMFGELPSWGCYTRHAADISFSNIKFSLRDYDFRPAFVFDDVKGLSLKEVNIPDNQIYKIDTTEK